MQLPAFSSSAYFTAWFFNNAFLKAVFSSRRIACGQSTIFSTISSLLAELADTDRLPSTLLVKGPFFNTTWLVAGLSSRFWILQALTSRRISSTFSGQPSYGLTAAPSSQRSHSSISQEDRILLLQQLHSSAIRIYGLRFYLSWVHSANSFSMARLTAGLASSKEVLPPSSSTETSSTNSPMRFLFNSQLVSRTQQIGSLFTIGCILFTNSGYLFYTTLIWAISSWRFTLHSGCSFMH